MRLWKPLLCLLVVVSAGYTFNHPEIQWKSVSTEHFNINYYNKTEPAVYAAWKIAEETYNTLAPLYDYKGKRKIELSLADYDDYSNGLADYTTATILIWTPDLRFDFRGNTTWLRNVITHEITHILSLENKKSMIDIVANIQLATPNEQLVLQEPFARITMYPDWLAEGMAQHESERLGHDCWDSRREMLLRNAVLSNSLLTLDEMGYFNHDSRGNEMVYNQGMSFVKFLENRIGYETITSIFKEGASKKIDFLTVFSERTSRPLDAFYYDWKDSLKQHYSVTFPSPNTQEKVLYRYGIMNTLPRVSPDGKLWGWFSSGKDDGGRTDLIICENGKTEVKYRFLHAATAWDFSKDSKKIYFVKDYDPNSNGSYLNDIFAFDIASHKISKITKDARIYDLAISPLTGAMACVTYNAGAFSLSLFDEKTAKFSEILKGVQGEPVLSCSWSPTDSSLIALSKIVAGKATLHTISIKDHALKQLTTGAAQEESPYWTNDGRILFSADYDGVFNIYSIKPDGTDLKKYTAAVGGCFSPLILHDNTILYTGYGKSGFTIAEVTADGQPYEIPAIDRCTFKTLPEPKGKVTIKSHPYEPKLGRALWDMQFMGIFSRNGSVLTGQVVPDSNISDIEIGASISSSRSDALSKKSRVIGAVIGVFNETRKKNTSANEHISGSVEDILNNSVEINNAIQKFKPKKDSDLQPGFSNYLSSTMQSMIIKRATGSDTSSTDSTSPRSTMTFMMPMISWTNNVHAATFGLDLSAEIVNMMIPLSVDLSTNFNWQLNAHLHAGFAINASISPLGLEAVGNIPLSISWSNVGYYNKDISYNYNDYSQVSIDAGPQFVNQYRLNSAKDTVSTIPSGLFADVVLFHGFPLGKYMTLQLFTIDRIDYFNEKVFDNEKIFDAILETPSRTYVNSATSLNFAFPLIRDINRGSTYYADALYGTVGYTLQVHANGEFFDSKNYSYDLLSDKDFSDQAIVGHSITGSIVLGHYKSYMFLKHLQFDVAYELLRKKVYLALSMGL